MQTPETSSDLMKQYKDEMSIAEISASSVSRAPHAEAPRDETYKTVACNDRIAELDYLEIVNSNPACSRHLQVPQNAITHNTLQVMIASFLLHTFALCT